MAADPLGRQVNNPRPASYAAINDGTGKEIAPHPSKLTAIGADLRAVKGVPLRGARTKIPTPLGDATAVADNARCAFSYSGGPQWRR
jgi:hypothetical protein